VLQVVVRALAPTLVVIELSGKTANGPAVVVPSLTKINVSVMLKTNGVKNKFVVLDVTTLKFTALFVVSTTVPIWITSLWAPTWKRRKVAGNKDVLKYRIFALPVIT
jgi:hypothetical protein